MAQRVTQELLALKPFVFPAPKPKPAPPPTPAERNGFPAAPPGSAGDLSHLNYLCEICADQPSYLYCDACRAEYDKREREKYDRANAHANTLRRKRREEYAEARRRRPCKMCREPVKTSRKDARYCSNACRQKHFRPQQRAARPAEAAE